MVPARAALAGNPSDLYGGAVAAVPVWSFTARARFAAGRRTEVHGDPRGTQLVSAALDRTGATGDLHWSTTIPESVGLAGSSAIVIATIRAVLASGVPLPRPPRTDLDIALLAQRIEADDLGIRAGIQDRVVQAWAEPVLVDLASGRPQVEALVAGRPFRFVVAWLPAAAEPSGAYHRTLAATVDDHARRAMLRLGEHARHAGRALAAGDARGLRQAMGESAALRSEVAPLGARHDRLAAAVSSVGLQPNSAGSGGAVVALLDHEDDERQVSDAVEQIGGRLVVEALPGGRA